MDKINGVPLNEVSHGTAIDYCIDNRGLYLEKFSDLHKQRGDDTMSQIINLLQHQKIAVTDLAGFDISDEEFFKQEHGQS